LINCFIKSSKSYKNLTNFPEKSLRITTLAHVMLVKSNSGANFINICKKNLRKCFAQLFSSYKLALLLFGAKISVKNLCLKCWWNHLQIIFMAKKIEGSQCVEEENGQNVIKRENPFKSTDTLFLARPCIQIIQFFSSL